IWPSPAEKALEHPQHRRVDLSRAWVLPRPRLGRDSTSTPETIVLSLLAIFLAWLYLEPLALRGPSFLLFYLLSMPIAGWRGQRLRRHATGPLITDDALAEIPRLDAYEAAILKGGGERACQVAVTNLLARKILTVQPRENGLMRDAEAPRDLHRIEKAVY